MDNTREKGHKGEDIAAEYLIKSGYRIRNRNWFAGKNEIDIIAETKEFLIFVEVKSAQAGYYVHPRESVTVAKQRGIIMAASVYTKRFNINKESRFDIISIITGIDPPEIEHIEDAFYPTL